MLAQANRRAKVHESVARFLAAMMPEPQLIEIENAHHMDEASAELLSYLTRRDRDPSVALRRGAPGLQRVRGAGGGDRGSHRAEAARSAGCAAARAARDPADAARRACARGRGHALRRKSSVPARPVAEGGRLRRHRGPARFRRSGGDGADRLSFARRSRRGSPCRGVRIDLPPADARVVCRRGRICRACAGRVGSARRLVRRGAGRLPALSSFAAARRRRTRVCRTGCGGNCTARSRRTSRRNWTTRRIWRASSRSTTSRRANTEPAWRYAIAAAKRAEGAYAYVEAAGLYARALEAGRKLADLGQPELAGVHQAMGDAWYRAGEFGKASEAYTARPPLVATIR